VINTPDVAQHDALVACCKALASPIRMSMVQLIHAANEPLCACDIEQSFDLSQPTISHHLRILRDAGIIAATARGTNVYFHIERAQLMALACCIEQFAQPNGVSA
jgi:DNA-binding transcriptional ArsR family regulator